MELAFIETSLALLKSFVTGFQLGAEHDPSSRPRVLHSARHHDQVEGQNTRHHDQVEGQNSHRTNLLRLC